MIRAPDLIGHRVTYTFGVTQDLTMDFACLFKIMHVNVQIYK